MKYKMPDSSFINPPHKVEGDMGEARKSFYELAKGKVKYFDHEQFMDWVSVIVGKKRMPDFENNAVLVLIKNKIEKNQIEEKFVTNLEIAVDSTKFELNGENYSDILPFAIEHELYESWIRSKKGFLEEREFSEESRERAHQLAMQREFLLAERAGKAERVLKWRMIMAPGGENEYLLAWKRAKIRLRKN